MNIRPAESKEIQAETLEVNKFLQRLSLLYSLIVKNPEIRYRFDDEFTQSLKFYENDPSISEENLSKIRIIAHYLNTNIKSNKQ